MPDLLRRFRPDALALLCLLLLPLILFAPATLGGKTLLPADVLYTVEPWRTYAAQFDASLPHNDLLADLVLENYVWKQFILEQLRAGEIPLWNPYLFAGVPFLAAGQHSALYPFSALFYVMPLWRAYGWFAVSQVFVAGLCAYLFLRTLRLGRAGALAGAVVYQLSLFMTVSTVFPMIVAGAAWLPLVLACIDCIVQQRPALGGRPATLPWAVLGALALGMQMLAGHPEVIYYSGLIYAAYALYRLAQAWPVYARQSQMPDERADVEARGSRVPSPPGRVLRRYARPLVFLAGMVAAGVAVGAVQLLPLLDLVRFNFRTGSATLEQVRGWGYPARHLIAFLIPDFFGNPAHHAYFDLFAWRTVPATVNALGQSITKIDWGIKNYVEGGAYVGLLPLLLSLIAIITWIRSRFQPHARSHQLPKPPTPQPPISPTSQLPNPPTPQPPNHPASQPPIPFFSLLAALSLAFAFGTPLYALVYALPGLGQLHSPFRWVWPFSLCIAVLTGFGFQDLTHPRAPCLSRRTDSPANASPKSPGEGVAGGWVRVIAGFAFWGGLATVVGMALARIFYDRIAGVMDALMMSLAKAPEAFADGRMFFSYEAPHVLTFGLRLMVSGMALRLADGRARLPARFGGKPIGPAIAVGVIALDLLVAGYGFNSAVDPRLLDFRPPAAEFLQSLAQKEGPFRVTTFDPTGAKPFNANTPWMLGLQDVRGYDSIIPRQYAGYMAAIEPQGELQYNRIAPIFDPASLDSPLLDVLNVRYVASLEPIASPKFTPVYDGEVKIYRNEGAAPRAFSLPLGAAVYSAEPLAAMRSLDPRRWVIVDDPAAPATPRASASPANLRPARIDRYTANEVTLTASVETRSYLVLADSDYPGWLAYVRPAGADQSAEQSVEIHRVDGNFRGVVLPPGEWTVRFKFSPFAVRLGAFVSAMALMTLAVAAGGWLWRFFYRESAFDSPARRVAKNSLAPMALNLMNRGMDMIFAAFMLRLLGPGDAGKYYFAVVVVGWFEIVTNYGLNTFLTREVARDREHANRYLVNTTAFRMRIAGMGMALLGGLLFVATRWFGLATDTALAIVLFALGMLPASVSTGLTALFYAYEKAEVPAALTVFTTLLRVTFGALALLLGYSFVGLAGVTLLVNTATMSVLLVLAVRAFFRPRYEYDPPLQRQMLRESFPLMLNHLLATVFFKVDVTLLQPMRNAVQPGLGDREVGWYSTAYKFVDAYNIIPSFFTLALFPLMSRQAREDRPALARSFGLAVKLLVATALPLAIATSFLAPALVGLLGGAEYLPHGALALLIMVWSIPFGWINSVTNYVLIALDEQRDLSRAFGVGVGFNIAANVFLLGRYGYPAAAAVTIASEMALLWAFYLILRRSLGRVPWLSLLWRIGLSAAIMGAAIALLWPVQPALALVVGALGYPAGLWLLKAFDPGEVTVFRGLLPKRELGSPRVGG